MRRMGVATIRDVARRAGVAISTASAALNRSAPVSAALLARVQEAARDIGYVPHGGAQSLRRGRSSLIGVVVPSIANPHFALTAQVIEGACLRAGCLSVVYSSGQDAERELAILRRMRQERVAGLILVPSRSDRAHGESLRAAIHVPTVLLDMPVEGLPFDVVALDNRRAARLATACLAVLGHRRIAALAGLPGLATSLERLRGHAEALEEAGLPPDPALLLPGGFDRDAARAALRAALGLPGAPPTAIASHSNMMTLGALQAARDLGLRVPGDLSLVGVDDLDVADLLDPPPTLVRAPVAEMAERAIGLLLEEVGTGRPPEGRRDLFAPLLIERASALPPSGISSARLSRTP